MDRVEELQSEAVRAQAAGLRAQQWQVDAQPTQPVHGALKELLANSSSPVDALVVSREAATTADAVALTSSVASISGPAPVVEGNAQSGQTSASLVRLPARAQASASLVQRKRESVYVAPKPGAATAVLGPRVPLGGRHVNM